MALAVNISGIVDEVIRQYGLQHDPKKSAKKGIAANKSVLLSANYGIIRDMTYGKLGEIIGGGGVTLDFAFKGFSCDAPRALAIECLARLTFERLQFNARFTGDTTIKKKQRE